MSLVTASDGLPARDSGPWARQKLQFLDHFCPSALQATVRKHQRYFVDLFAGPGINVERGSRGQEFPGSPLRVLGYHAPGNDQICFTDAIFVNNTSAVRDALDARISDAYETGNPCLPRDRIQNLLGDSNVLVTDMLERIPRPAYAFVFADIEAPRQLSWNTVAALRETGHQSIDFYVLFPLDMAVQRLISYREDDQRKYAHHLDEFFGTDRWRELARARASSAQAPELRRKLVELYLSQLNRYWREVGDIMDVHIRGRQRLYKMLFATDHPAGVRIAEWIKTRTLRNQGELFS